MADDGKHPAIKTPAWQEYVPGAGVARSYQRAWLPKDIVAGLVLSALLVPQGMAYAELAGLPPVTGLYTSILCLLGYAVFGPSRVLVLGPDSSLGPMIAATIAPLLLANGDPARAVALASMLAVMVGVVMTVAGLARFGFVADLLSKPTQIGYMNGLALTIVIGQLAKLFGFSVDADGLLAEAGAFFSGLADGDANTTAALLGIGSLAGILLLNRFLRKLPSVLIIVVLASILVSAFDLQSHDVDTVGKLPQGFPPFTVPGVSWSDLPPLFVGALAIAVVALADTMSTASAFAARRGDRVRGNQEMVGIGAANIAAGFFQGFPVSTSGSRTAVAEQAGSRSQVTGIVGAATITVVLVVATSLMQYVPQPTLGAIVIAAALSLADIAGTRRLWHQRKTEFGLSIIALLGVALLGVLPGILIAVGLSILNVFRRAWWPHEAELGRVEGIAGLHDTKSYPDAELLPGLVVYRFDAPLIFANARMFGEKVREIASDDPEVRWIIVAAEPITDVDTTASDMLQELDAWLNARDVSLVFAELKDPVRSKIERYELTRTINPAHFLPTLDAAVAEYVRQTGASWHSPQPKTDDQDSRR
ncbi:high affinity sulfate transporter 1 [Kribbella rubisoli]|uniref:High affinity sulfate transporter 1 n=1 Tax=Kribbella rubisoli TaxID=3075929 RepID=A0A4Q7WP28_9ACTN|nr:sulfate permease [Kribbella rubisoli]RZU11245.1 high affinity sulfate transporter 1 [Kribbella rubisoli]